MLRFVAGGIVTAVSAQAGWALGHEPSAGARTPIAGPSRSPSARGLTDAGDDLPARARIMIPGLRNSGIAPPPPPPPAVDTRFVAPAAFQRGDPAVKVAYLTMDDCWSTNSVASAMEVAERYGARLTFFPYAQVMAKSPDLWRDVQARGHGIENHTLSHKTLPPLSDDALYEEMQGWNRVAREVLDEAYSAAFFRPPSGAGVNGRKDERIFKVAAELGMKIAMWSSDSQAWKNQGAGPDAVASAAWNALNNFGPGSIVLQHAIACDVQALPSILEEAKRQALACRALGEGIR